MNYPVNLGQNELHIIISSLETFIQGFSTLVLVTERQVLLFGVVGIVLATATTTLVGREWAALQEEERLRIRPYYEPLEPTEDGDEREEDGTENSQENLNVLHLLYTIAQVLSSKYPVLMAGPSTSRRICA
jgi:hypothetical protein